MLKSILPLFLSMIGTVVFTLFFVYIFANSTEMNCASQGDQVFTCSIEKKLLGRWTTSQRTIKGVIAARVEEDCNDGCSYRVELTTTDGNSEPFDDVYTDRQPMTELANKINTQIKQSDGPAFTIREDMQWWLLILLFGLGLMSLVVETLLIFRAVYRWTVNRQQV